MADDFSHVLPVEAHVASCLICRSVVARQMSPRAVSADDARKALCGIGRGLAEKALLLGGTVQFDPR